MKFYEKIIMIDGTSHNDANFTLTNGSLSTPSTIAVKILSATNATSAISGALIVSGGVGIAQDLYIGGKTKILSTASDALTVGGSATIDGHLEVDGDLEVGGDVTADSFIGPIFSGRASSAQKLQSIAGTNYSVGNTYCPVYFNNGIPVSSTLISYGTIMLKKTPATSSVLTFIPEGDWSSIGVASTYSVIRLANNLNQAQVVQIGIPVKAGMDTNVWVRIPLDEILGVDTYTSKTITNITVTGRRYDLYGSASTYMVYDAGNYIYIGTDYEGTGSSGITNSGFYASISAILYNSI